MKAISKVFISVVMLTHSVGCSTGDGAYSSPLAESYNCGNSELGTVEVCDGENLDGKSCDSLDLGPGQLTCSNDCKSFNVSDCQEHQCSNGSLDTGELCDGTELQSIECKDLGFEKGTLKCRPDCLGWDVSSCYTRLGECGDGLVENPEICDGNELNGSNCESLGYIGGSLACAGDCKGFDTSSCMGTSCGNGTVEGPEVCDDEELNSKSCEALGFTQGGKLSCRSDCLGFDTSECREGNSEDEYDDYDYCEGISNLMVEACFNECREEVDWCEMHQCEMGCHSAFFGYLADCFSEKHYTNTSGNYSCISDCAAGEQKCNDRFGCAETCDQIGGECFEKCQQVF